MIPEIRNNLLSVVIDSNYQFDDARDEEQNIMHSDDKINNSEDNQTYNVGILKQIQIIFGHLSSSLKQFYVPKGFWKHFKYFPLKFFQILSLFIINNVQIFRRSN